MGMRGWMVWAVIAACGSVGSGCDRQDDPEDCATAAAIVPGCGVTVDDGALVLELTRDDVIARFGAPDAEREMTGVGRQFTFPDAGLGGMFAAAGAATVDAIVVGEGFAGTTAEGVGLGSAEAAVTAAFGEPTRDPFLGSWWYLDVGIGFEWSDGIVSRIHVVEADAESD